MALTGCLSELTDDVLAECNAALEQGSRPLLQLISPRIQKQGIPARVQYLWGGMKALNTSDPRVLKTYFTNIERTVPEEEQAAHQQALSVIFEQVSNTIVRNSMEYAETLTKRISEAMGLDETVKVEISSTASNDSGSFIKLLQEEETDDTLPTPLLH